MSDKPDIRYAHPSHEAFNERLEKARQPKPREVTGPWIDAQVLQRLPNLRHAFDMNRDPSIRRQMRDMEKTEAQRREEQSGRGSAMVGGDKPEPTLRPKSETGKAVDREHFRGHWLAEQRDAAFEQAARREAARGRDAPDLSRSPNINRNREPSR